MSGQPLHFDEAWLRQKYLVEGLGCPQIGALVDRDAKTILHWLRKYGIPTRPRGSNYRQNLSNGRPKGWHHTPEAIAKVREATIRDGRVPYLKDGVHHMKGKRGPVVHNWKGGVTPERQTVYRSDEWRAAVKVVWQRDNAICQRCGLDHRTVDRRAVKFHVHHIVSFAVRERRADPANLVLLCDACHHYVHSRENVNREFLGE